MMKNTKETTNSKATTGPSHTAVLRGGLSLPAVSRPAVGASRHQLAVALMDTSLSMNGPKLADANRALLGLVTSLADPKSRGAFSLAVISYAESAEVRLPVRPIRDIVPNDIDLVHGPDGCLTNITGALERAKKLIVDSRCTGEGFARPLTLLLSDGEATAGGDPLAAAADLKRSSDVICAAFGSDCDFGQLEAIATTPKHAVRCATGDDLARFFQRVGTTMSIAAVTGADAATLLGASLKKQ